MLILKGVCQWTFLQQKNLKIKIKSYGDKTTGFHDKETHSAGFNHTCLAVIIIDSALKEERKNYLSNHS